MSEKSTKLSKASGRHGKAAQRKERLANHARRQLVLYLLALGLFGVGAQALYSTRARRVAAHPLNEKGLRVSGRGRADATRVLSAALFSDPRVKNAYRLAAEIPETLNQLYCWCGCIERGMRSNLECFESTHASVCDVCMAGAEIAWEMKQRGITDPAKVQQALDARFGRSS